MRPHTQAKKTPKSLKQKTGVGGGGGLLVAGFNRGPLSNEPPTHSAPSFVFGLFFSPPPRCLVAPPVAASLSHSRGVFPKEGLGPARATHCAGYGWVGHVRPEKSIEATTPINTAFKIGFGRRKNELLNRRK
jgi:hypothetical protein